MCVTATHFLLHSAFNMSLYLLKKEAYIIQLKFRQQLQAYSEVGGMAFTSFFLMKTSNQVIEIMNHYIKSVCITFI